MQGFADRRFATVAIGLLDAFWLTPLTSPVGRPKWSAIGLESFAPRYFAVRSAPLGGGPTELVTAAFFGWHPPKLDRYLPAVWERTTPAESLATLVEVADESLGGVLGDWVHSDQAKEAADLLRSAAESRRADLGGRALFAAYAALPWPDAGAHHLTIWHAGTLLREFRGDNHIALLVANGIDPCECHLLMLAAAVDGCECHAALAAMVGMGPDVVTPPNPDIPIDREWPVEDRRLALQRLVDGGLLTEQAGTTPEGMALHLRIEADTDRLSALPAARGTEDADHLADLLATPIGLLRASFNLAALGPGGG